MIITNTLKQRLKEVEHMGIDSLEAFRFEVASSLLDNDVKFYCYDIIDKRKSSIEPVICNDLEFVDGLEDELE